MTFKFSKLTQKVRVGNLSRQVEVEGAYSSDHLQIQRIFIRCDLMPRWCASIKSYLRVMDFSSIIDQLCKAMMKYVFKVAGHNGIRPNGV